MGRGAAWAEGAVRGARVRWWRPWGGAVRARLAARAARRFSSFFSSASSFRKRFDSPKASAAAKSPPYSRASVAASSWLGLGLG